MREAEMCNELGWSVSDDTRALVRSIYALPLRKGSASPQPMTRHLRGPQTRPCALPRAQARKSRDMARVHVVEGRMCHAISETEPSLRIVIDTSGSMGGSRIREAIALAGAVYLSLSPQERRSVEWYTYTTVLTRIEARHVPHLTTGGGTALSCLQPALDASSRHDRWLVITDGEIPDLASIHGSIALILIGGATHRDPRCISWSRHDKLAIDRNCRRLQKLLRV